LTFGSWIGIFCLNSNVGVIPTIFIGVFAGIIGVMFLLTLIRKVREIRLKRTMKTLNDGKDIYKNISGNNQNDSYNTVNTFSNGTIVKTKPRVK